MNAVRGWHGLVRQFVAQCRRVTRRGPDPALAAWTRQINGYNQRQPNGALLDAIRAYNHQVVAELARITPLAGKRLLDVGASPHGYALEAALQHRARSYLGIGLDVAAPLTVTAGHGTGQLLPMDATALDLPDGCMDLVLSISAFEHISDVARALAEIARVLVPGTGKALITFEPVWTCSYGHHLHHFGSVADLVPPWAHLRYSRSDLTAMLSPTWPADAPITLVDAMEWVYAGPALNRVGLGQMRDHIAHAPLRTVWLLPLPDHDRPAADLAAAVRGTGLPAEELLTKGLSVLMAR
jgi:SAM-dependent methyltransferase